MTRRAIKQLSASLINRIAAGEVIERPASVVKELVENSIDAGATDILVEVEDGGRALIRVTDNGLGIPAEELPLALASHATSKLETDDDLFAIRTMGFRGEALASIGSVSQARIVSRPPGPQIAHQIACDGGELSAVIAAAANGGTSIDVRNLFFNMPARRKFLRGTATEFGHISQTLLRLALPFPNIAFRLIHNGRKALELPMTDPLDRLLSAWPREFHDLYLPVGGQFSEVSINGIVGLPELARPTPLHQYLFLNGRAIRDKFISHALREAYRGLCEPGRHPAAVILLHLPPDEVDVNVHPTKSEIRFRDGQRIHSIVYSAVREKLLSSDLAPAAVPVLSAAESAQEQHKGLREKLAEYFQQSLPEETAPPPQPAPAATASSRPRAQAIQLHNSYLIAQTEDGLIIIDQHALHERIIYEELLARLGRGPLESQRLLLPISLPASPRQMELLERLRPMLERLGIEAGPFGPDSVAVQAFPSFLNRLDPARFVAEILERGEQELLDLNEEELLHEVLDMMACKAAVKAGDALTPPEIEAMLARRVDVDRASNCPHGRPTTLRLTLKDLEKQFKRTGF
ncbi:MAG TPA: DNA mismatch repair endonuclease MutL [Tepidisphaeraceae bacterium]|nr:DNA mismatch repair endonuclease MutL [Tepidisphaeraceae bacterium]